MIIISASIFIAFAIISIAKPKIGVYALWFFTWLYPVGALHALLPLHIRFDDLFLLWISMIVFLRRTNGDERSSIIVKLAFFWFAAIVMGNLVGLMTGAGHIWQEIVRHIGKRAYIPLTAYIVWKTARNEKDIITHIIAILLAGIGTTIIAVLQVKVPHIVFAWEQPGYLYGRGYVAEQLSEMARRAGGPLDPIYFAATAMTLLLLAMCFLVQRCGWKLRLTSLIGLPLFTVGLIFSATRSSIAGAILGIIYTFIRGKRKFLIIIIVSSILLYVAFGTNLIQRLMARISGELGTVEEARGVRIDIWKRYIYNFSPHYFFFGRGFLAEEARFGGAASHSSYIGAFAYTGVFGAFITFMLLFFYWRYANILIRMKQSASACAIGEAMRSIMIATLFVGIVNELLQGYQVRLIAVLGVLAERYIWLYHNEETGYEPDYLKTNS